MIEKNLEKEKISGLYFSALVLVMLLFSVVISVVLQTAGEGAIEKDWYKFLSYSVSPIAIFTVTAIFKRFYKLPTNEFCSLKKADFKYYFFAVVIFISVFFGLGNLNGLFIDFLTDNFGYVADVIVLPKFSVVNFVFVIITLCVLPAVMEEVALRGVLLYGVKSRNTLVKALIGGLLFSLFHMNPAQTPYQFAVGFAFSLLAVKSRSIYPTVVAHFLNNLAVVVIEYFFPTLLYFGGWVTTAVSIVGSLVFITAIILLIVDKNGEEKQVGKMKDFWIYSSLGTAICLLTWIMNLAV